MGFERIRKDRGYLTKSSFQVGTMKQLQSVDGKVSVKCVEINDNIASISRRQPENDLRLKKIKNVVETNAGGKRMKYLLPKSKPQDGVKSKYSLKNVDSKEGRHDSFILKAAKILKESCSIRISEDCLDAKLDESLHSDTAETEYSLFEDLLDGSDEIRIERNFCEGSCKDFKSEIIPCSRNTIEKDPLPPISSAQTGHTSIIPEERVSPGTRTPENCNTSLSSRTCTSCDPILEESIKFDTNYIPPCSVYDRFLSSTIPLSGDYCWPRIQSEFELKTIPEEESLHQGMNDLSMNYEKDSNGSSFAEVKTSEYSDKNVWNTSTNNLLVKDVGKSSNQVQSQYQLCNPNEEDDYFITYESMVNYSSPQREDGTENSNNYRCIVMSASCMMNIIVKEHKNFIPGGNLDDKSKLCRSFPDEILNFVKLLPGNDVCCSCGLRVREDDIHWAIVTVGTLLCERCAAYHILRRGQDVSIYLGVLRLILGIFTGILYLIHFTLFFLSYINRENTVRRSL